MGHTSNSVPAGHVWPIPSAEMLRLVAMLTVLRLDTLLADLEGIRDNLVTLERLAENVTTTSTAGQAESGSSSETSMGAEDGVSGVHSECPVDELRPPTGI